MEPIETKTTTVKSAEPLKLKLNTFSKGFKIEVQYQLDPNNPIDIDRIMSIQPDGVKFACEQFIKLGESLGYSHLTDQETKEAVRQP